MHTRILQKNLVNGALRAMLQRIWLPSESAKQNTVLFASDGYLPRREQCVFNLLHDPSSWL